MRDGQQRGKEVTPTLAPPAGQGGGRWAFFLQEGLPSGALDCALDIGSAYLQTPGPFL